MSGVRNWFTQALVRFARAKRGSAAVEFGLVAIPFFFMTFGMAEIAVIGFTQTTLDHAVAETARSLRTGQAQTGGVSYTQMQTDLCTEMTSIMRVTCAGNLFLDVDTFASFVAAQNNSPIRADGTLDTGQFGYSPGASSSIVVVRAYYRWRVLTPFFQSIFANASGGERILVSTMMFRNEPW